MPNNGPALSAFLDQKNEIDRLLERLQAASADHFGRHPDEVTWADRDTLDAYRRILRMLADRVFKEGEHAR